MKAQSTPIEIFIADDHELVRQGFRLLLEREPGIQVIGEAINGADLVEQMQYHTPDIILVDIQMPVMDGAEATKIITKKYPGIRIITLSLYNNEYNIIKMVLAGAQGHLSKAASPKEMVEAIKTVYNHGMYYDKAADKKLSAMISNKFFDRRHKQFTANLTERETEVLRLICMQKTNREISSILTLSIRTIEDFRTKLLVKTGSGNAVGLVLFALRYGIYDLDQSDS